jgi:regulator of RNase E activity RraA
LPTLVARVQLGYQEIANPMTTDKSTTFTLAQMQEKLYCAVVSDALDSMGLRRQSPRIALPPVTGVGKIVGRCKTTLWEDMAHEDSRPYELELQVVDNCKPGEIILCAAAGSMRSGIWGELLSTAARNSGCVGAIVDGAVRDISKMTEMQFPVFARGACVYDSLHRQRVVDVDVPVEIDGVRFEPGDLVFADIDGIVVVPREAEREAIQRAWDKVHAENKTRDEIRAGSKAAAVFAKYGIL